MIHVSKQWKEKKEKNISISAAQDCKRHFMELFAKGPSQSFLD